MAYADLKNDFVFRKVFGEHPDVLMGLLNDLLALEGDGRIEALEYLPTDQVPKLSGFKLSILDVRCRDHRGVTFIVEMQVVHVKGYLNRVVYYASRAYAQPLDAGKKYTELAKVIAVSVCEFELWPDAQREALGLPVVPLVSLWQVTERESGATEGMDQVRYLFCELPKLRDRTPATPAEKWAALFRAAPLLSPADVASAGLSPAQQRALDLANEANFTPAELDAYERTRDEIWQGEQREADARARGRQEGLEEGEARGRVTATRSMLLRLWAARGEALTAAQQQRVQACTDAEQLEAWVDAAAGGAKPDAVLE